MSDYNKSDIGSGYNTSSALNTELGKIETSVNSKVDKTGSTMNGALDMNSNQILNLPKPISGSEPLRKQDVAEMIGDTRFIVDTFSELQALNVTTTGQRLVCTERFNSEYIVRDTSYVALPGDATLASGVVAELQQSDNGWHIEQFGAKELTESTQAIKDARDRAGTSVIFGNPISYFVNSELVFSEDKCGISSTSGTMVLFNTSLTEKTLTFSPANPELGNQINNIVLNGVRLGRSAGSTNAVALSLYAVNSPRITNFISDGSHTAVDIKGISDANFSNWWLFAGGVSGYSAGSSLIEYDGYPLSGGGFTKAFTTNIVNSIASTDFKCDHVLNVHMCDGLEISNSYWGSPFTSHVNLKPTNNNEGITKLLADNIYFDGISPSTGSIGAVTIPTVTATGTFLAESKFNNCSLSNFTGDAVSIQGEANSLKFNDTTISNVDGWAINSTATNGSLKVLGGEVINVDIGTGTGGITVGAIDSVNITGVEFKTIPGTAVSLSGTTNGTVCASTFEAVGTEISESGVANYKSVGNVSDGSAMKDIVDIGGSATFTPTISFGGASVGVTYSTQEASYQKIGDYVHFNITIVLTNKGSSTGDLVIGGGLPVCDQDSALSLDIRNVTAGSGDAYMSAFIVSAGTGIQINRLLPSGARQVLNDTDITNTTQLRISGVYKA